MVTVKHRSSSKANNLVNEVYPEQNASAVPSVRREETRELEGVTTQGQERDMQRPPTITVSPSTSETPVSLEGDDAKTLSNHIKSLLSQFKEDMSKMEYVEEAITKSREALSLRPPGHSDRSMFLDNLARSLEMRFEQTGKMEDLDEAVAHLREVLSLHPRGDPQCSESLSNLAGTLWRRFEQTENMEDLEEAIAHFRESLPMCPPGDPNRYTLLNRFANSLWSRFKQTGKMEDIDTAISMHHEALSLCTPGGYDRTTSINNLASSLRTRFQHTKAMEDLEESIVLYRESLSHLSPGHLRRSMSLSNLANSLWIRFDQTRKVEDLDEAIVQLREALSLCPPGHPRRYTFLNNLAASLQTRSMWARNIEDLDESIEQYREALSLCPPGHSSQPESLINVATSLWKRFTLTANMEDIEEAIGKHREAFSLCPPGHRDHSISLNNLATCLKARFGRTGKMEDLEEAIVRNRESLSLSPPGNLLRATYLINLSSSLQTQFQQTRNIADLEEATTRGREALSLCPPGHPDRLSSLGTLSISLNIQFLREGNMEDLEEAIAHGREANSLCPPGHPDRHKTLYCLCVLLREQFKQARKMEDLEEAIACGNEALSLHPPGDAKRSEGLHNLAAAIIERDPEKEGSKLAFDLWQQAVTDNFASTISRFEYARAWAITAMRYHHESAVRAYSHAIILLTRCLVETPTIESQQDFLARHMQCLPYDAAACAILAGQLDTAVEFLEQGRSLLWSRMNSFRHPIESLYAIHHNLAQQFQQLTTQLEHLTTSFTSDSLYFISDSVHPPPNTSVDFKTKLHRRLLKELDAVIDQIREKEGFQDFLQPVPFKCLHAVTSEGPVIIVNTGCYSSDAIVLYHDKDMDSQAIVHIPLIGAGEEILKRLASQLEASHSQHPVDTSSIFQLLRELWQTVVRPITDKLLELGIQQKSRVWWCPTSMLCSLPLHAAGPYAHGRKNFSDIYILSYTPTLSALIKARSPTKIPPPAPKLLAIGISDEDKFHYVQPQFYEELSRISQIPNISVKLLDGQQAVPDVVLSELPQHSWVHFACHGHSDTQPFLSSFELNNGKSLTLVELIKAQLPNAEFAFLSACHSAAGGSLTPDESIHLAAALQFCGFRSTVGTLWSMADEDGPIIVEEFYKHMFHEGKMADYRNSARALNKATRAMRQCKVPIDRWICFVHIGA